MVVVADMENQILRIPANGVHQKTVNRTGPTYNASLGHARLPRVCMVCV